MTAKMVTKYVIPLISTISLIFFCLFYAGMFVIISCLGVAQLFPGSSLALTASTTLESLGPIAIGLSVVIVLRNTVDEFITIFTRSVCLIIGMFGA